MTQYARPDSDVATGGWNTTPPPAALYTRIDEVVAVDGDYIESGLNPSLDTAEVGLSNIGDPATDQVHVVRYRYEKDSATGKIIDLYAYLVEGTTVIASWTHLNIGNGWVQADQTLTGVQADSITDYDDLRLRFVADVSGTGAGRRGRVSWAVFEALDVPLAGTVAGQSSMTGRLTMAHGLKGACEGQSAISGALSAAVPLAGTMVGTSSMAASLSAAYSLKGLVHGQSAFTPALSAAVALQGAVAGKGELAGYLQAATDVGGRVEGKSGLSGRLTSTVPLAGTIGGTSGFSGFLSRLRPFKGTVAGVSDLSAKLTACRCLRGEIPGVSGLLGFLTAHYKLAGIILDESILSARITILGETETEGWGGKVIIPPGEGVGGRLVPTK